MPYGLVALLTIAVLVLGVIPAASSGDAPPLVVYVGTYTDTSSKGIYRFTLDPKTGVAGTPELVAESLEPLVPGHTPQRPISVHRG